MGITRVVLIALAAIWCAACSSFASVRVRHEVEIRREVVREPREGGLTRQRVEGDGEEDAPDQSEGRRRNGVGSAAPNR